MIIPFDKKYLSAFVELNREWITTHFEIEPMDMAQLENPYDSILNQGGEIFFLLENDEVLATFAMVPHGVGCYELAKMAVKTTVRGKGYGDQLMKKAKEWAKEQGAQRIMLLSNTILEPAIALYLKHGFDVVSLGPHPDYKRSNIEMQFLL